MKILLLKIFILLFILVYGCRFSGVKGSGDLKDDTRTFENIEALEISGAYTVNIKIGVENKVFIQADDNLIPLIKTKFKNSVLLIYSEKDLNPSDDIKINITVTELNSLVSSGASNISSDYIESDDFNIELSGAGSIEVIGKVKKLNISMSGAGSINSKELIADDVSINVSGVGSAQINAQVSLQAQLSGVGNIQYVGNPESITSDVSGVGSITRFEDE
jgi:hypothetical protein